MSISFMSAKPGPAITAGHGPGVVVGRKRAVAQVSLREAKV
jgi:hypothetical protein